MLKLSRILHGCVEISSVQHEQWISHFQASTHYYGFFQKHLHKKYINSSHWYLHTCENTIFLSGITLMFMKLICSFRKQVGHIFTNSQLYAKLRFWVKSSMEVSGSGVNRCATNIQNGTCSFYGAVTLPKVFVAVFTMILILTTRTQFNCKIKYHV
jgi:hypothetical protein